MITLNAAFVVESGPLLEVFFSLTSAGQDDYDTALECSDSVKLKKKTNLRIDRFVGDLQCGKVFYFFVKNNEYNKFIKYTLLVD